MIGIVSSGDDLHALYIADLFEKTTGRKCHIIDSSDYGNGRQVSIRLNSEPSFQMKDIVGEWFSPSDLKALWFRRVSYLNDKRTAHLSEDEFNLLRNEHHAVLHGCLDASFHGTWINDPNSSRRANSKIFQLKVANEVGLRTPDTLIGNDFEEIRDFSNLFDGKIIVKPNYGLSSKYIFCEGFVPNADEHSTSLQIPAIYQQMVHGDTHLRVNLFGDYIVAFEISSPDLDWRANLNRAKITQIEIESKMETILRSFLDRLGLLMGIFDLKISDTGEVFFLEVNSQGQFLFLEPFGGKPSLPVTFVKFLVRAEEVGDSNGFA